MKNTNILKRSLCFVMASMMLMPNMPSNLVNAAEVESALTPGTVSLTKEAKWFDYNNKIAEITLTVKGEPVKTAADVVLVVDTSGSMGLGPGESDCPCTNPEHWTTGEHRTDLGYEYYDKREGCSDRLDSAKAAANAIVAAMLENNPVDENGNQNRIALVEFNSDYYGADYSKCIDFTTNKSDVTAEINSFSTGGGTRYTYALEKAWDYITARNTADGNYYTVNSRPTYIIMLSDDAPEQGFEGEDCTYWLKNDLSGEQTRIYTVGLNMGTEDASHLMNIATNGGAGGYYTNLENTAEDLVPLLEQIASATKPAGEYAVLTDVISPYFDYYTDSTHIPTKTPSEINGKTVKWDIGTITANEQVIKFYVKLKPGFVKGTYPTNDSAVLDYTTISGGIGSKTAESPQLSVECGSITVNYLLVDEATGKYIATDGNLTDDISYAQRVGGTVYSNQDYKSYTITPAAPEGYTLYKDSVTQNIVLTDAEKDKAVDFKVYAAEFFTIDTTVTNGTITDDVTIVKGQNITIEYAQSIGYKLTSVTVDGTPVDINTYPISYTFSNITDNHTVSVIFEIEKYTVTYKPGTLGTFAEQTTGNLTYGMNTPAEPEVKGNAGYTFTGWSQIPTATVTESAIYVAQWSQDEYSEDKFTVIFVDYNGTELKRETDVVYGSGATAPADPTREGYKFIGWDVSFNNITANTTVTAQYSLKTDINYTVEYETADGKKLADDVIITGKTISATVTENAKVIAGYTVDQSVKTLLLKETGNVITFIYSLNTVMDSTSSPRPPVAIIEDPEFPLAYLEKFDHFAYIIGYPEGDVRPLNTITREEVAMIFYRLMTDESRNELLSDINPFTDIQGHSWSNRAISTLYNARILNGYSDGSFRPSTPITRAEFAAIIARFDKLETVSSNKFTDIAGHWAEKYINSSELNGWIKGYEDNTFRPDIQITRAESMTLINNALGRIVIEENIHPNAIKWPDNNAAWYYEAVEEATNSHDYVINENNIELWTKLKANKVWP